MDSKDVSDSNDGQHLENGDANRNNSQAHHYVDHRENDDRAEEAKGRFAESYDKKYWLSVNYIGSMFAIGMAFMGGIGGTAKLVSDLFGDCADLSRRIRLDCACSHPD